MHFSSLLVSLSLLQTTKECKHSSVYLSLRNSKATVKFFCYHIVIAAVAMSDIKSAESSDSK